MTVPSILLVFSVLAAITSAQFASPLLSGPLLLALLCVIASLILVAKAWWQRPENWIVVDGSNVLYWRNETPSIETVRMVLSDLRAQGFQPLVWFDANAGYLIGNRYMGPGWLSHLLDLPACQVFVAPKGTPADPLLLDAAIKRKVPVVSNDKFRDWAEDFPKVKQPGFLIPSHNAAKRNMQNPVILPPLPPLVPAALPRATRGRAS